MISAWAVDGSFQTNAPFEWLITCPAEEIARLAIEAVLGKRGIKETLLASSHLAREYKMNQIGWLCLIATTLICGTSSGGELFKLTKKKRAETKMVVEGFLYVDTEDFDDYGGWRMDTQFVHLMGS
ncbi:MAG: hypothetical protein R6X11_00455, partial [Desulfonatronovibrio sp.]